MVQFKLAQRIIVLLIGFISISIGVSLFIISNIGSDPFNVLMQGLSNIGGLSIGICTILINLITACIIFFWDKQYLKIGSFLSVIFLGPMIDCSICILESLFFLDSTYFVKFISMMIGTFFISLGISITNSAGIGMIPNAALPVVFSSKKKLPFKWVRIGYDIVALILGITLGGIFGVGTVFFALTTGPIIAFFNPRIKSFLNNF